MGKNKVKANDNHVVAEYLAEYYNMLDTIKRLNKEIKIAVKQGAPSNKLTACYDDNKGGYVTPSHSNALNVLSCVGNKVASIQHNLIILEEMTDALSNLSDDERLALIMRYVDQHPIKVICNELKYSSRQSVYNLLSSAMEKFSRNWGFKA